VCEFLHAEEILVLYSINHHWHTVLSEQYYCDDDEQTTTQIPQIKLETMNMPEIIISGTENLKVVNQDGHMVIDLVSDDEDETVIDAVDSDATQITQTDSTPLFTIDRREKNEKTRLVDVASPLELDDESPSLVAGSIGDLEDMISQNTPIRRRQPTNAVHATITHKETPKTFRGTTLYCDDFFIRLTEPFWTLCVNPNCYKQIDPLQCDHLLELDGKTYQCYYIDYSRPIFPVEHFLKVLRFFDANEHLLQKSGIRGVSELFFKLEPYTSLAITDKDQIPYLIDQVKKIARHVDVQEPSTVPVSELSYLCAEYINQHKKHFENHTFKKRKAFQIVWNENRVIAERGKKRVPIHIDQIPLYDLRTVDAKQFVIYDDKTVHLYQRSQNIVNMCMEGLFVSTLERFNGGSYRGDTKRICTGEDGEYTIVPHGEGFWTIENATYRGYWIEGEKCGDGCFENEEILYQGEWLHDTFHGLGTLTFKTKKCTFYGHFLNGKRNGFGIQYFQDQENDLSFLVNNESIKCSSWYRGNWRDDEQHGYGEYRNKLQWKEGQYRNGVLCDGVLQEFVDKYWYACTVTNYRTTHRRCHVPQSFLRQLQDPKEETNIFFETDDYDDDGLVMHSTAQNANKARRTVWNGYLFRSRLEARWSIFFEYLQIDYLYEPKTFPMPNDTHYTPDFYLPAYKMWLEIKPTYPTEEERTKAKMLSNMFHHDKSGNRVFLFYGNVFAPFIKKHIDGGKAIEFTIKGENEPVAWTQCNMCSKFSVGYRCQPTCHPTANGNSVEPSLPMRMAYEYVHTIDFDAFNDQLITTDPISSKYF
jgi:hypothetical protein